MKFIPHTVLSVTPFMHAQYNFLQLLSRPSVEISAVLISWSHLSRIAQQYTVIIIIWLLPSLPLSLSAFGLLTLLLLAPLHLPINTQSSQIHQPQQPFWSQQSHQPPPPAPAVSGLHGVRAEIP